MPEPSNRQRHAPVRTVRRALRAAWLATCSVLAALTIAPLQASATPGLQAGQVWSGSYRCGAISGRAAVEVTRFEPIAERPGWQRIEATLTFEEGGRRGTARFAANNPTRSELFGLSLVEWIDQPGGIEFRQLRIQPMLDAGRVGRIGVNVMGRPECIVNGVDSFAFTASPDRQAQQREREVQRREREAQQQQYEQTGVRPDDKR